MNIGHIQLCAGLGDLTKQEGYDAVVMLWIDDSGFQHGMGINFYLTSEFSSSKVTLAWFDFHILVI